MNRRKEDQSDHDRGHGFDFTTVLLIATVVLVVLYLTWELWAGHPFSE